MCFEIWRRLIGLRPDASLACFETSLRLAFGLFDCLLSDGRFGVEESVWSASEESGICRVDCSFRFGIYFAAPTWSDG